MIEDHGSLIWEDLPCEWCVSNESEIVHEGPDLQTNFPGQFRFVRCKKCGLYRQNPRLNWESLKNYYPNQYHSFDFERQKQNWLTKVDRRYGVWKRLKAIEKFCAGGKLLEVGCGTGSFLEEVMRSGKWEAEGIEPVFQAAEYAKSTLSIQIHNKVFAEVQLPKQTYDIVVMWNVLEHLSHPIQDLRKSWDLLKPGGLLVFSVPNLNSLGAKIFGRYWVGWELPRHLFLYPMNTLRSILTQIGFELLETRCLSTSYGTLGTSLTFWTNSWNEKYKNISKILMAIYWSYPMKAILIMPLWLVDRLKKSTIITIFIQKPSTNH